jgi:fluoride exporter
MRHWSAAVRGRGGAMTQALLVFVGGGLGAVARWGFGLWAVRTFGSGWPWGTFGVNVLGGLAMGLVMGFLLKTGAGESWRLVLVTGFLGGFTTFSAFSLDVVRMIEAGNWGHAALYVALSVVLSVGALLAGLAISRLGG